MSTHTFVYTRDDGTNEPARAQAQASLAAFVREVEGEPLIFCDVGADAAGPAPANLAAMMRAAFLAAVPGTIFAARAADLAMGEHHPRLEDEHPDEFPSVRVFLAHGGRIVVPSDDLDSDREADRAAILAAARWSAPA